MISIKTECAPVILPSIRNLHMTEQEEHMKLSLSRTLAEPRLARVTRRTMVAMALIALAGFGFAQAAAPAPQNQIDLGGGFYGTDITAVYGSFQTIAASGQTAKYSPSANWNGKYTFTLPLDKANTLKFALADDGWYGFYTGTAATAAGSGQNAGVITPLVEYLGFGADITLTAPIYYYNPADASGYNELKYAYKESSYLPLGPSTAASNNYPLGSGNSMIPTINLKAFYKYSFDKTTWVSGGVGILYAVSPTPWLTYVLPKVSVGAYGAQLDLQYDYFNAYNNNNAYYDTYLEPKLTYDLGFTKLVPGLKVYGQGRVSLSTTNTAYNTIAVPNQAFHDSYFQPGLNYSFAVPKVGNFAIDAGWRFAKIDNVGTVSGTGYTGIASNPKDVAPYSELRVAVSYSYKF